MNKSIDVIGVQMDFGASKRGVAMGPAAIRYAGLLDDLKGMGFDVHDKGDILAPSGQNLGDHAKLRAGHRRESQAVR